MKRFLLSILVLVLVGVPFALVAGALLCFEDQPALRRTAEFTPQHVERARRILARHDPRKMKGDGPRSVEVTGEELDLAANYLANRYGGSARITLQPRTLRIDASVEVPHIPFGRFVNLRATLRETAGLPALDALRIGRLPLPGWLARPVLARTLQALIAAEDYRLAAETIRSVGIANAGVRITYAWHEDLADRLRVAVLPQAERELLKIYHERLVQLAADAAMPREVSLTRLLAPLMQLAAERSRGGEPQAENRALIAVLAFYVNGGGLAALVPEAKDWPRAAPHTVTLAGRQDFPQHFVVSAALAAFAGSPLADAIGLAKEVDDSRGGSGFSFNDIAADRAGTAFGELATRSGEGARSLQRRIAVGLTERDMIPEVADLPEFMPAAEFKRRFGGVGAPAYDAMMREIDRRIAACALYR